MSTLVGREPELAEVAEFLRAASSRPRSRSSGSPESAKRPSGKRRSRWRAGSALGCSRHVPAESEAPLSFAGLTDLLVGLDPLFEDARVLAELSARLSVASIKNKHGQVIAHVLRVTVTDAGDRVPGAVVTARGAHKTTDATGTVQFKWSYKVHGTFTVGITKAGYWRLTKTAGF